HRRAAAGGQRRRAGRRLRPAGPCAQPEAVRRPVPEPARALPRGAARGGGRRTGLGAGCGYHRLDAQADGSCAICANGPSRRPRLQRTTRDGMTAASTAAADNPRRRIDGIDTARALAIALAMLSHCFIHFGVWELLSDQATLALRSLTRSATPTFIVLF